ncbi:T9SS type A sorting domain-containing protein [Fulvivirga maritima]|uniref:T9SS type A sorting domain-containing protein n=1 Tax=Fulvivirga maritima TaxID=2904247 RepID=UPI001F1C6ED5|nr:T9SS type A sorting domain-containing protein [Fulvivirga maritima]UII24947.1 T9SS type A sorting domain-containing protein [Fulvivirga maritima]
MAGLRISGNNAPVAYIRVNPLVLSGDLFIENGASLNANGIDLTLQADFVNNGTYIPAANTTIFRSSQAQSLSGTGLFNFFDFTKQGTGALTIEEDIAINNLFRLEEGILQDSGNNISLYGDAIIDATHQSGDGNGLVFLGGDQQRLQRTMAGTSDLGVVTINNAQGVIIPEGNGYNFNVNNQLRMQSGVFNIGSSLITVGQNADIAPVTPFSVTNMIRTNSSFADNGVRKVFPAGYNSTFIYPIGESKYTPVTLDFSGSGYNSGNSLGSITAKPANEYHPAIDEGIDYFASGDINNVLQYYWTLRADNLNNFKGVALFQYDEADVAVAEAGYSEEDYLAAQILYDNNPNNNINKFTTSEVNHVSNIITFALDGGGAGITNSGISGDYFAGIDNAIPDNIATYISQTDGDVNQEIYDQLVPGGGAPQGAILIVDINDKVVFNLDNINLYKTEIREGATLTIDETLGHRLGIITGTGTLKLVSNGNSVSLPAGDYSEFFSCSGGELEYAGSGNYYILGGINNVRKLSLTGGGQRRFPNNDITVCEDFLVDGPQVNYVNGRTFTVNNEMLITAGTVRAPSGNSGRFTVLGNTIISGGGFRGASSGRSSFVGNLTIDGGDFNVGSTNYRVLLYRNLSYSSGSFNAGIGSAQLVLSSSSVYNYTNHIYGDFTGLRSFYNLSVDKDNRGGGVALHNDIQISNTLTLTDGVVETNGHSVSFNAETTVTPAAGNENSYIDGKVIKPISSAGQGFTFPLGNSGEWRPARVLNVSEGGRSWGAEYFSRNPLWDSRITNLEPTNSEIKIVSNAEYWVISDGTVASTGVTASVGLSWGLLSDVSFSSSEREELEVLMWNENIESWDNYGGGSFSSGHTQSFGTFVSTSPMSFSEHVFTLGSGDEANPLPISLESFTGENDDLVNHLYWTTLSETNNDYFEIQRSVDGVNFETITIISGAGTSAESISYNYTDATPGFGVNYYRLKQVDFDGTSTIAPQIVRLELHNRASEINVVVYPNPAKSENLNLRIITGFEAPAYVKMYDLFGRVCYERVFQYYELNEDIRLGITESISSGIYVITIEQGGVRIDKKVMISDK